MRVPNKCVRRHAEVEFSVREQLSEVVFHNPVPRAVQQITVDGCVFKGEDGKRCDHLINVDETDVSVFVELKGSDILAAFQQLRETQEQLAEQVNRRVCWIISYSGSPRFTTTVQDLINRAAREKRARLSVEASPYTHTLR